MGSFDKNDPNVGTGLVGAPACGDVMKLQIRVDDDGNIVDSCFKTFGCGSAIASSSVATEWYVQPYSANDRAVRACRTKQSLRNFPQNNNNNIHVSAG